MGRDLTYAQHARAVLVLGLPLVGSQVAQMLIGITDAAMLGWYDVAALAAEVLANSMFIVLLLFGSGFAFALSPLVAEAEAQGDLTRARRLTRMAFWLSALYGVAVMPLLLKADSVLTALGQTPEVAQGAGDYLRIAGWAIFPALGVTVLRNYLAALERTRVVFWVTLAAVAVNAFGNWLLIFGNWGFPELGLRGAAISSVAVHAFSFLGLIVYVQVVMPEAELFRRIWRPDVEALAAVFKLGWPIGITVVSEVGLFAASAVMMGWLGAVPLAAHGIAMQVTSITFMVHLGLSNAATIRAGRAQGARDWLGVKRGAEVALALSAGFVVLTIALYLLLPETLVSLFLSPDDPQRATVIAMGKVLLAAAAFFQLMDAGQVMALGLLRGVQDTRRPMLYAALSYWGIGAPMAYLLGFVLEMGGVGVWLGLASGLASAAALMMSRFWRTVLPARQAGLAA